jgi:hypothetical protein
MDDRLTTVLLAMFLGMTVLAVLCYTTIFVQPNIPFNPLSPQRATVVAGERLAALATQAPVATTTPGPIISAHMDLHPYRHARPNQDSHKYPYPHAYQNINTYTNFNKHVYKYTVAAHTPPTTTPTATPFPFIVVSHSGKNNCADTGLEGVVNGPDGLPRAGVQVQYGEIGVAGSRFIATTDNNGRYGALLIPGASKPASFQSHDWYAYVVESGQRASDTFNFTTDPIFADNPDYCGRESNQNDNNGNSSNNSNSLPAGCTT